jgi:hypothetical protein
MKPISRATAVFALAFVSIATFILVAPLKTTEYKKAELRKLSDVEKWKTFLYEESIKSGLRYEEFKLLSSIVQCESSWRQFYNDGSVVFSSGNIGLAQINRLAHETTYQQMHLNPNDPYDNLQFMIFLYTRDGINPWKNWSGHCFLKEKYAR